MKTIKRGFPEFLEVLEYTEILGPYSIDKVAMFNSTVISAAEVESWIEQGLLDMDLKPTVVVMTKKQYENLFDHVSSDEDETSFYEDLRIEQQGGIR